MGWECFDCKKVFVTGNKAETECPSCGSANGRIATGNRIKEGLESGAYWNIDPRTGKRQKKKR